MKVRCQVRRTFVLNTMKRSVPQILCVLNVPQPATPDISGSGLTSKRRAVGDAVEIGPRQSETCLPACCWSTRNHATGLRNCRFLAAVALADAVDKGAGTLHLVSLKWPNDLLVEGAKLSGILLEAETLPDGRQAVVLGFGVNCVSHPPLALYEATDLRSLGYQVSATSLFEALAGEIIRALKLWQQPDGFSSIRRSWLKRAAHLGKQISVKAGSDTLTGMFVDLDARGHLVLKLDDGELRTIYAGDVFLSGD